MGVRVQTGDGGSFSIEDGEVVHEMLTPDSGEVLALVHSWIDDSLPFDLRPPAVGIHSISSMADPDVVSLVFHLGDLLTDMSREADDDDFTVDVFDTTVYPDDAVF